MKASLFGPVLWFDLVRTARRGRFVWARLMYLGMLLFFFYLLYRDRMRHADTNGPGLHAHEMAEVGTAFFGVLTLVQFLAVFLAAPLYAGSALAEEKERGTLEFLLASDLRSREIVLSKLLSRLANLLMLVMTGLPVLGLVQFMGGVDPDLALLSYLGTALMALSLASLALLVSLYSRTAWDGVVRAYIIVGGLIALTFLFGRETVPLSNLGNPAVAAKILMHSFGRFGDPTQTLIEVAVSYTLYHLALTLVCCTWALLRLRAVALRTTVPPVSKVGTEIQHNSRATRTSASGRPPVTDRPLLWKELYGGRPVQDAAAKRLRTGLVWLALIASVVFLVEHLDIGRLSLRDGEELGRLASTVVVSFTLFLIGVGAAGRFSREVEKQTLDTLLTLPERDDIIYSKWLASLLRVRGVLWLLGPLWLLALLTGAIHPVCWVLLLLAYAAYGVFLASLGLWFSVVCRSTVRATLMTFLSYAIGLVVVFLALVFLQSLVPQSDGSLIQELLRVAEYVIFPPMTLWEMYIPSRELDVIGDRKAFVRGVSVLLASWTVYIVLARLLYVQALRRFRKLAGESGSPGKDQRAKRAGAAEGAVR